jgi:hypothetical protein
MLSPGAETQMCSPRFEPDAGLSSMFVAPTAITLGLAAG